MRYLSDDGKLFNTVEECEEHEKQVKQEEIRKEEMRKAEAKKKEKEEGDRDLLKLIKILDDTHNSGTKKDEETQDLRKLLKMVDEMQTIYEELEDAMTEYEKKHHTSFNENKKKKDYSSDMLFNMLRHL